MIEVTMNNAKSKLNGIEYDFTGYNAELKFNGKIVKVTCIKTGKDCTREFLEKYEAREQNQ